jgi:hypothetical protein
MPLAHGLPEGRIEKRYDSFPILAAITANKIRTTPGSSNHIASIFVKRLFDTGQDVSSFEPALESNIIAAIKSAIPRGLVLASYPSDDSYNPNDRQLELYTYVRLSDVSPKLEGIAKLKIAARLSIMSGSLTIRSIQKHFPIEES